MLNVIIILLLIALICIEGYIANEKLKAQKQSDTTQEEGKETVSAEYLSHYTKKSNLLTPTELKFYKILKQVVDSKGLLLFSQVAMYQIVNCKEHSDFNRIRSKSIDFVVTDQDCKILCCLELDDYTHNYKSRQKRDKFVEDLLRTIGTPLIRVKVKGYYNMEWLTDLINNLKA